MEEVQPLANVPPPADVPPPPPEMLVDTITIGAPPIPQRDAAQYEYSAATRPFLERFVVLTRPRRTFLYCTSVAE